MTEKSLIVLSQEVYDLFTLNFIAGKTEHWPGFVFNEETMDWECNINDIPNLLKWLAEHKPSVLPLVEAQFTKIMEDNSDDVQI